MCGRFLLNSDIDELIRQYKILYSETDDYKKGDIYPSQIAPIVLNDKVRALRPAKWGFPFSGKSKIIINARSESIAEKSMFRSSFNRMRCIIPANLFYEWKDEGNKNKIKHNISLFDQGIFSLGGIYKFILNDRGEKELSFVIITTQANSKMKSIHSRMPLIIESSAIDYWLNNDSSKNLIEDIIRSNVNYKLKIDRNRLSLYNGVKRS